MARKHHVSVGIKALKNDASRLIDTVSRTGQTIAVTKNGKEVAQIVPVARNVMEDLVRGGALTPIPTEAWRNLELEQLRVDSDEARRAIEADRDD